MKRYKASRLKACPHEEKSAASLALLMLLTKDDIEEEAVQTVCNCAQCVLNSQNDFRNQRNGVCEVYDKYNAANGTRHRCEFLPKFHPELNPQERIWGRMKYHTRIH